MDKNYFKDMYNKTKNFPKRKKFVFIFFKENIVITRFNFLYARGFKFLNTQK